MLEYGYLACPLYRKDRELLEHIQRRPMKMVPSLKELLYEERLQALSSDPML